MLQKIKYLFLILTFLSISKNASSGQTHTQILKGTIVHIGKVDPISFVLKPDKGQKSGLMKVIILKGEKYPKFLCRYGCKPFENIEPSMLHKVVGQKYAVEWTLGVEKVIPSEEKTFSYDSNYVISLKN